MSRFQRVEPVEGWPSFFASSVRSWTRASFGEAMMDSILGLKAARGPMDSID